MKITGFHVDYTKDSEKGLKNIGRCFVSWAFGRFNCISLKDVTLLEVKPKRFSFKVGHMHFEIITNDDNTASLYLISQDGELSILIE